MTEPSTIQLFGGLRLRLADRVTTRFRTQKTGALLAYLAYHRGQSHSREVLVEIFWPDTEPESGRHNLSHALSSFRSLLEPPGVPAGAVVVADRFSVALNPDAFTTDVADFEHALRVAAQARNSPEQAGLLLQALERYTGALLPEFYQDWIVPAQERLALRFRQATLQATELLERSGDLERAFEVVQRTLALDPQSDDEGSPLKQVALRLEGRLSERRPAPPVRERHARRSDMAPPTLPVGTVTVLMTDIEGSTALWEAAGDAFREALSLHHELLRREFVQNGGREINEAGDSFLVVFPSVGDALACAIACQRALEKESWPQTTGAFRVRMALHTGDVEWEDGEVRGVMLHRAARMLAAAHGGQILCSEATSGLLVRDLEPGVHLEDLGLWQLRDVKEPERLFQIEYPQMPERSFPTLNASPVRRTHLPLQFTRFFGRETELARIVEILSLPDTRLFTLTGPGGTGKTRLSLEGAGRFAETFPGPVWFVPLADLSDPDLVPQAILRAMNAPPIPNEDPFDQAVLALAKQPTLLILDNFEQLVEGGAPIVQELLARVGSLRCMATSRQTLGLPGEVEFAVPPLPTPNGNRPPEDLSLFESVRLFLDRAQAARPDFRITNANAPALAELCDRLEGIPLAIELAAARAFVLSPSQMLAQLGNRFEFLVSRKRGVAERQRTLRAAVDWSYRLLTPDLQRFFARLCVFRGGWTLEAAEAVCDEPMALDMLAQLRECSLVSTEESDGGIRFRMMETLREYAQSQLAPEEESALQARHAAFFLALYEEAEPLLWGHDEVIWLDRLEREHDNLRAVLAWCDAPGGDSDVELRLTGALGSLWFVRGYSQEGLRYLRRALAREPRGDRAARAKALRQAAQLAGTVADFKTAEEWSREGLEISRALDDQPAVARLLCLVGNFTARHGTTQAVQAARDLFEQSLALSRQVDYPLGIAAAAYQLGILAQNRGDLSTATAFYDESLALHRELGERRGIWMALNNLGLVANYRGDNVAARDLFDQALVFARELKDPWGIVLVLMNRGAVAMNLGELSEARQLIEEALALERESGSERNLAQGKFYLGKLATRQGDRATAHACYTESLTRFAQQESHEAVRHCLERIAELIAPTQGARLWGAAARYFEDTDTPGHTMQDHGESIAAARAALGDDAAFDAAWQEGRALTLEQAVAIALSEPCV